MNKGYTPVEQQRHCGRELHSDFFGQHYDTALTKSHIKQVIEASREASLPL